LVVDAYAQSPTWLKRHEALARDIFLGVANSIFQIDDNFVNSRRDGLFDSIRTIRGHKEIC
jgi:hypothetical protein